MNGHVRNAQNFGGFPHGVSQPGQAGRFLYCWRIFHTPAFYPLVLRNPKRPILPELKTHPRLILIRAVKIIRYSNIESRIRVVVPLV